VKLAETQRWFAGAVTDDAHLERTEELLTRGPRLDAAGRLDVYRHGYVARLVECLGDDYPALQHALGKEAFEALSRRYIAGFPSVAPNLNAYGARLSSVCDGFAADLARLEWAMVEVIHEPAAPAVTMEALAAIPPESWGAVRLVPSKALRLLIFDHPVNDYYQAFRDDLAPAIPAPSASATVVYRSGRTVWRMGLTASMRCVLAALVNGKPLERALDLAGDTPAADVTSWFREWMASGLFVGVVAPPAPAT
jgi:hypothetical protein